MTSKQKQTETATQDTSSISASEQVSVVVDDVRALVKAEMHYYRSRLDYSVQIAKRSLLFGAVALVALFGAAMALVFGLVMTLTPVVGPGWATLIVTVGLIVIGAISGLQARNWLRKISFPEIDKGDDNAAK